MFWLLKHLPSKQALNSKQSTKGYERKIQEILRRSGYFREYDNVVVGKPFFEIVKCCDICRRKIYSSIPHKLYTYTWLIEILRHAADCLRLDAEPRKHKKLGYLAMSAETWWYLLLFSGLLNFHLLGYPLGSLYRNEKWIKNSTSYYIYIKRKQVISVKCFYYMHNS